MRSRFTDYIGKSTRGRFARREYTHRAGTPRNGRPADRISPDFHGRMIYLCRPTREQLEFYSSELYELRPIRPRSFVL